MGVIALAERIGSKLLDDHSRIAAARQSAARTAVQTGVVMNCQFEPGRVSKGVLIEDWYLLGKPGPSDGSEMQIRVKDITEASQGHRHGQA